VLDLGRETHQAVAEGASEQGFRSSILNNAISILSFEA
jgi:hypothetical protein